MSKQIEQIVYGLSAISEERKEKILQDRKFKPASRIEERDSDVAAGAYGFLCDGRRPSHLQRDHE